MWFDYLNPCCWRDSCDVLRVFNISFSVIVFIVSSVIEKNSIFTTTMPLYYYTKIFLETNYGGRTNLSNNAKIMG